MVSGFIIFQSYYTKNNKLFQTVSKNTQFYQKINRCWRFVGLCSLCDWSPRIWVGEKDGNFIFIRNSGLRTMEKKMQKRQRMEDKADCSIPAISFFLGMEESRCRNVDHSTIDAPSAECVSKRNSLRHPSFPHAPRLWLGWHSEATQMPPYWCIDSGFLSNQRFS